MYCKINEVDSCQGLWPQSTEGDEQDHLRKKLYSYVWRYLHPKKFIPGLLLIVFHVPITSMSFNCNRNS